MRLPRNWSGRARPFSTSRLACMPYSYTRISPPVTHTSPDAVAPEYRNGTHVNDALAPRPQSRFGVLADMPADCRVGHRRQSSPPALSGGVRTTQAYAMTVLPVSRARHATLTLSSPDRPAERVDFGSMPRYTSFRYSYPKSGLGGINTGMIVKIGSQEHRGRTGIALSLPAKAFDKLVDAKQANTLKNKTDTDKSRASMRSTPSMPTWRRIER
ncbi:hypothetical protein DFQ28_002044 [Apophysomyces sp. BC1034]|nr:hypothetical protein DFQ28_002044 [Apophysomyces sp. BC1034]